MSGTRKSVGCARGFILFFFVTGLTCVQPKDGLSCSRPNTSDLPLISKEKQLIKCLLDRYALYGKVGRPVINTSDSITVNFGISLIQILKVDEKNQVLETNVWQTHEWYDALLRWNASEFDGIKKIRVPSDQVWIPDIKLYNFADSRIKEKRDALVVVEDDGKIFWMPQAILRSNCMFSITYFPFDTQTCKMKFGSWTYNGNYLDIQFFQNMTKFSLADYMSGTEWTIVENFANRTVFFYECCPDAPYPDVTFYITIKRRVAFYSVILILPCLLLSLLTLVIFWVPPESPAKLVLGMNVFVAFFVLLLLLAESTPKGAAEAVPLIGAYFCLSMIMITLSTILATIITNMFFRGVRINRAPACLRRFMIDFVAKAFFIRDKLIDEQQPDSAQRVQCSKVRLLNDGKEEQTYIMPSPNSMQNSGLHHVFEHNSYNPDSNENEKLSILKSSLASDLRRIREILELYKEKKEKVEKREKHLREWKVICCVTDRLFFLLYLFINIVGIIIIFFGGL